jgi:hypothetical protein
MLQGVLNKKIPAIELFTTYNAVVVSVCVHGRNTVPVLIFEVGKPLRSLKRSQLANKIDVKRCGI